MAAMGDSRLSTWTIICYLAGPIGRKLGQKRSVRNPGTLIWKVGIASRSLTAMSASRFMFLNE